MYRVTTIETVYISVYLSVVLFGVRVNVRVLECVIAYQNYSQWNEDMYNVRTTDALFTHNLLHTSYVVQLGQSIFSCDS